MFCRLCRWYIKYCSFIDWKTLYISFDKAVGCCFRKYAITNLTRVFEAQLCSWNKSLTIRKLNLSISMLLYLIETGRSERDDFSWYEWRECLNSNCYQSFFVVRVPINRRFDPTWQMSQLRSTHWPDTKCWPLIGFQYPHCNIYHEKLKTFARRNLCVYNGDYDLLLYPWNTEPNSSNMAR